MSTPPSTLNSPLLHPQLRAMCERARATQSELLAVFIWLFWSQRRGWPCTPWPPLSRTRSHDSHHISAAEEFLHQQAVSVLQGELTVHSFPHLPVCKQQKARSDRTAKWGLSPDSLNEWRSQHDCWCSLWTFIDDLCSWQVKTQRTRSSTKKCKYLPRLWKDALA